MKRRGKNQGFSQPYFFSRNRKGEILIENVVFIILNVIFLSMLIFFLTRQASAGYVLEETYAKEIALVVDYSKPNMLIKLDMDKGLKISNKEGFDFSNAVVIDNNGNSVFVKLTEDGGYSYNFFNDVHIEPYPDEVGGEYTGLYVLTVSEEVSDE